jgi:hypothetical protein
VFPGNNKNAGSLRAISTGHHEGHMLARHLLCGILAGSLTALASLLAGHAILTALTFYVAAAYVGFGASVLNAHRDGAAPRISALVR